MNGRPAEKKYRRGSDFIETQHDRSTFRRILLFEGESGSTEISES